jgi:hypothetical protein
MDNETNKKRRSLKKILIYTFLFVILLTIICIAAVFHTIYSDVKQVTKAAQSKFPGDSVQALITYLQSDDVSFENKNKAVWALGQIADPRALQPLRDLCTSVKCQKPCSKKNKICQYELEKAMGFCSGEFTATKWMYSRL